MPSTGSRPRGMPRSSSIRTVRARRAQDQRVDGGRAQRQVRMLAASERARRPHRRSSRSSAPQSALGERVLDAQRERERVSRPRLEDVLHHHAVRLALADRPGAPQRTRPWIAFPRSGSVSGSWWRAPVELVGAVLEPVRPGISTCPRPDGSARRRRSRRAAPARRPRTTGALRRPRRPSRAGRRMRSRTARRTTRATRLDSSEAARRACVSAYARVDRAGGPRREARSPSPSGPGSPRRCSGRSSCRRRRGCPPRGPCSWCRAPTSAGSAPKRHVPA